MNKITNLKRIGCHLTEKQIERLKGISNQTGVAYAVHIRFAVDDYLKKIERKIKEVEIGK